MPLPIPRTWPVRKTLADSVYDYLYEAILSGDLLPGEVLNDKAIAEGFGMSRTPVREALRRLSMYQLVEMVPSKYNRVAPRDESRVLEASITMFTLYQVCLREGIPLIDAATRVELDRLAGEVTESAQKTYEYFHTLASRGENPLLLDLMHQLAPLSARALESAPGAGLSDAASTTFTALHLAVMSGDTEAALRVLETLTAPSREAFRRLVRAGIGS